MPISATRAHLTAGLLDFVWGEWAQLGVSATATGASPWCQDPEALLLLTFEVARSDPRLFEEVLDWVVRNDALVSARRMRSLCVDDVDRRLVGAVLEYSARARRPSPHPPSVPTVAVLEPLFRGGVQETRNPDPAFAEHGFAKTQVERSGKSGAPDLLAPVSFAMRMRQILGVGARAEVLRMLLTVGSTTTGGVLAQGAGYARRNVQEALSGLHRADVVSIVTTGGETRYAVDTAAWRAVLGLGQSSLPTHRDWPQMLSAARLMLRWLNRPDLAEMSPYLRDSSARDLIDAVRDDLAHAGIPLGSATGPSVDVWAILDATADAILSALAIDGPGAPSTARIGVDAADPFTRSAGRPKIEVFGAADGYRWRLRSSDGHVAALSSQRFSSASSAQRDADRHRPGGALSLEVLAAPSGGWDVVGPGERRAVGSGRTQADALRVAEELVSEHGAGEVIVHGRDGRVVGRRTVRYRDRR